MNNNELDLLSFLIMAIVAILLLIQVAIEL